MLRRWSHHPSFVSGQPTAAAHPVHAIGQWRRHCPRPLEPLPSHSDMVSHWKSGRRTASRGVVCASAAASPAATLESASASKGQLFDATLGDGSTLWLEVVGAKGPRLQVLCYGEAIELNASSEQALEARSKGFLPRISDPWVKRCPGLAESLKRVRQHQQEEAEQAQQGGEGSMQLPSQRIAQHGIAQLRLVTSLDQFGAQVEAAPGFWCDGTGPGDPPPTPEQSALLSAGELLAFLQGRRGVCALQIYKGWGEKGAALQPLLRPFVLQLLQRAAEDKGVLLLGSAAPEGLGASLLLCPRQQPFKAWAEHLAKTGVQASLVADSPFYKLLVGRILGYKEENIRHHIQSMGGTLDGRVLAAVDAELQGLSSAAPVLPWKSTRRR